MFLESYLKCGVALNFVILEVKFNGLEFLKSTMPLKFAVIFYDFVRLNLMAKKTIKFIN